MYRLYTLLFNLIYLQSRCINGAEVMQLQAPRLQHLLQAGKTTLIYFCTQADPEVRRFLSQLEASAEALRDYGVLVAQVNCSTEDITPYCTGRSVSKRAHLFRGAEVLRSFDIDTLFDVHAIVSHMLFTLLYNEVRYVHTPAELLAVERVARGKTNIVMGHVHALGLPEHRALMEAAFVYGARYQFVQTTGTRLLQHMGVADGGSDEARLWFLHCAGVHRSSDSCPHTPMRKPLTTINIHTFLQLMEAPPLVEADVDPDAADVIYSRLNVPVLFLFSHTETLHADRTTAQELASRLRGEIGLVLIHRDTPGVKTPPRYNAAYRLPQQEVKYFSLRNVEEVISLIRGEEDRERREEEEEEEEHWATLDVLDDEVAESVYRERGTVLDLDSVSELTADTFGSAVTSSGLTMVLFYIKWDAVSMAFLQSYVEVADALAGESEVTLASVDCGEWTCVCREQNVTSFPSVRLFRPGEEPQPYRGMMATESLYRFLLLSRLHVPVSLSTSSEVLSFLEGDLFNGDADLAPVRVLGLFVPEDGDVAVFEEAAKSLRGEMLLGLFVHREASTWAEDHSVTPPALLVSRGRGVRREAHPLPVSTPAEMLSHVRRAALDSFPELTVENLPWYMELGRPLLLLFVGGESAETTAALEEMRRAEGSRRLHNSLPCWIHLGRTPVGRSVLETLLGFVPPLPAVVLSRLHADGKVYHFPPERPLLSEQLIQWLQSIEDGREDAAGVIPDESRPVVPFYDFLSVMDEEAPGYASQQNTKTKHGQNMQQWGEKGQNRGKERTNTETGESPQPASHHTEL